MSFASEGYQIINIGNKRELVNLRKTFIDIFSLASKLNGYKAIKSEKNIIDLYKKKKTVWVAGYDQIRMLPEINDIINTKFVDICSKTANIKRPAFTSKPIVRVGMPGNIGTGKTEAHIDYPSHRGSKNAITVWFPLQDTDKKNGTLKIYPKSHKMKTWYGDIKKNTIMRKNLPSNKYEKNLIDINLKLGQALVISQFLVHGSGDHKSNTVRFTLDFRLNDLSDSLYAQRKYYINQITSYKKTGRK
jgi:ectoine hydroxylase-related dioxygenase (phytanoyl-CoA dioxygenase family)